MAAEAPTARPLRTPGDRLTLRCGPMVHGGACVAHAPEGDTVLVDGAVPGELVVAEVSGRRGGTTRARAVDIVEPSAHRVSPPCRYVPECGGCDLQHIAYEHQVELKRDIVLDQMRRRRVAVPAEPAVHAMVDPWRYRWRGEFHVVSGSRGVRDAGLGFNRARSWRPIAVDDCLIHHRTITDALPALREVVRRGGTDQLTVLHLTAGDGGRELLVRPKPRRALDPATVDAAAIEAPGEVRWSVEATTLHWRGRDFRVLPDTFIQVNQEQMETLYSVALAGLGDLRGRRIVDAYAGIGALSTVIAEAAAEVVCIEANRTAASLGVLNARLNGVEDRVRYVPEPVETALPRVAAETPVDAVLLDPPRAGCEGSVTGWLALAGPPRVVYVSCDPATLARDLHVLATSGPYEVERLDVVDMFPQTHHIECVAALRRRG